MLRESERRVLVHAPLLELELLYVSVDLFPVVKIVGKGAVHLSGRELREIPEDVFSRQSTTIVDRYRTDGKACPFDHWPPAAYTPLSFNIGMDRSCFSYWHRNLSLFHVVPSFSRVRYLPYIYFSSLPLGAFSSQ
jgi:hypothetical protein